MKESKLSKIINEFKEYKLPQNKHYFNHYLRNSIKILFNYEPIDYKVISHENKIVHSSILFPKEFY